MPLDSVAHGVTLSRPFGLTRVAWVSILPGTTGAGCSPKVLQQNGVLLRACNVNVDGSWLPLLARAQQRMAALMPDWKASVWEIDLLPPGHRQVARHVRWSRGGRIPLRLVFAMGADVEASQRKAVNTIGHESFHVAEARRGVEDRSEREYRASLAGVCLEYAVFGSVAVQTWQPGAADALLGAYGPTQRHSLSGHFRAHSALAHFLARSDDNSDGGLAVACQALWAGQGNLFASISP